MRIAVSSYSFNSKLSKGEMNFFDVIKKSKELGFDGIEIVKETIPDEPDMPAKIKAACEAEGLPVCGFSMGADLLRRDLVEEIARIKEQLLIAAELGSPVARHDASQGFEPTHASPRSFDAALPTLFAAYRETTEFAASIGIKLTIENHGYFAQDSDRVERLVTTVNHPNFGVTLDIGNFLCADENPVVAVSRLLPLVSHVHAKDFHVKSGQLPDPGAGWFTTRGGNRLRGAIIGHGDVPVVQCLSAIKRSGYDGYVVVEFEGIEDCILGVRLGREYLMKYL